MWVASEGEVSADIYLPQSVRAVTIMKLGVLRPGIELEKELVRGH